MTWRAVPGYEGYYEVSSDKQVRSVDRTVKMKNNKIRQYSGFIMKQSLNKDGVRFVTFCKESKKANFTIRKLMKLVFPEGVSNGTLLSSSGTVSESVHDATVR